MMPGVKPAPPPYRTLISNSLAPQAKYGGSAVLVGRADDEGRQFTRYVGGGSVGFADVESACRSQPCAGPNGPEGYPQTSS